jgi:hypothetical protein
MLSPRIRRLKLDHDQLLQRFAGWPLIQITGTAGLPPEVYRFVYHVKGLFVTGLSAPRPAMPYANAGLPPQLR